MSFIEMIFARAMGEPDFAKQLFANTDQAIIDYELTAEEPGEIKPILDA